jgi:cell shape-determining protein MreC
MGGIIFRPSLQERDMASAASIAIRETEARERQAESLAELIQTQQQILAELAELRADITRLAELLATKASASK